MNKSNDPMTLLKHDHEMVKKLFKSIKESNGEKRDLFEKISSALEVHTTIEEEIFYPALAQAKSAQAKSEVQEAKQEHAKVKKILAQMKKLKPSDDHWEMSLKELEQDVNHHVQEEEGKMFPEARKDLSDAQLSELGDQLRARKQELEKDSEGRMSSHAGHSASK